MTEEEINIACAEAIGLRMVDGLKWKWITPTGHVLENWAGELACPNYCSNLNAARELAEWLNESSNDERGLAVAFCKALDEIHEEDSSRWIEVAVPSAMQVARAFVKIIPLINQPTP